MSNFKYFFLNRFPSVAIKLDSGDVYSTQCSCLVRLYGKCAHIAAVLYMVEEISFPDGEPKLYKTPTDRAQYWGRGATTNRNPQPIGKLFI